MTELLMTDSPTAAQSAAPLRLLVSRLDAARELQAQIKIGTAIRNQRLRDMRDLEEARAEKSEWILRTTDLLNKLFNTPRIAEECSTFVPTILPEFAEFGMFVETFRDELKQRLNKLQVVLKGLNDVPERVRIDDKPAATLAPAEAPVAASAPPIPQPAPAASVEMPRPVRPAVPMQNANPQPAWQAEVKIVPPVVASSTPPAEPRQPMQTPVLLIGCTDPSTIAALRNLFEKLCLPLDVTGRPAGTGQTAIELLDQHPKINFALICRYGSVADHLFDMGCCVGRLGINKVCVINPGTAAAVEANWVPHVTVDATDGWHLPLARLFRKGGIEVDLNKLC